MKKFLLSIIALLAWFCPDVYGQASSMSLGYVDGQIKLSGTQGFSTKEKNTWVSGAIYLTADQLSIYAGNHIDSIHAGLASRLNVDSLRVWLRTSLDGADLASGEISGKSGAVPRAKKGWNTLALNAPVNITGNEGLYVGYSFLQKGNTLALSVVDEPNPNALFVKLGSDAEWQDRSSEGSLAIEAFVGGSQLPQRNLTLKALRTQPTFVIDKGNLNVEADIRNNGAATVTSFNAVCNIDGIDETFTVPLTDTLAYGETKTVSFVVTPGITDGSVNKHTVTVTLNNVNGGDDVYPADNTLSADFEVVKHDFTRNVLIEEFTTEQCVNCPRVAAYLHDALQDERIQGRVVPVCHHSGYYTDWLTIPADNDWLWFFNGSSYAPAMMFDRYTITGASPVLLPQSKDQIVNYVSQLMNRTAFVSVHIEAVPDASDDNLLHVTVTGNRSKTDFTANAPRINVMLTEDNIKARSQAGAGNDYVQQHVGRAVNSTWGDELEWNGDEYTYTCDLTVQDNYDRNNLNIIAWVWDYDSNDPMKCEVANAASIPFSSVADGISAVTPSSQSASDNADYYTLDGVKLTAKPTTPGMYIVRQNSQTRKVVVK